MDHEVRAFVMVQGLSPEPLQQLRPIGGGEDILNRVFRPQRDNAVRYGEQEQVVIAEDDLCGGSKLFEIAQDAKGVGAAIDEIADAPEAVYEGIKPDEFEQSLQGARAALNVADCIDGHRVVGRNAMGRAYRERFRNTRRSCHVPKRKRILPGYAARRAGAAFT